MPLEPVMTGHPHILTVFIPRAVAEAGVRHTGWNRHELGPQHLAVVQLKYTAIL